MIIDYSTGKIVRPGSINHIPNYIPNYDNKTDRRWDFQSPKNLVKSINNITHLRHFRTPTSKEYQKFHKIKKFPQPDSKRIIISSLLPKNPIKRKSPIKRVIESKKQYLFHKKRPPEYINNNNYSFNNIFHKNLNISSSPIRAFKKRNPLYTKYHYTSQIMLLPGAKKRKEDNINDDINNFKKKQNVNKIITKYNTNIKGLKKDNIKYYIKSDNYKTFNNINTSINKLRKNKDNKKIKLSKIKRSFKISINDE